MATASAGHRKKPPTRRAVSRWLADPDVCLMLRVQAGDPGAFAPIVEIYWPIVFGRFYRQLGDREEAEDMTQEVFLRLYRYRDRYQPRAKFATLLFHIMQNVVRNVLRSRRRHPCMRLGSLEGSDGDSSPGCLLTDSRHSPTLPAERAEIARVVRHAVAGLVGRQRRAMELHQFHDRSYAQVASELKMSPKAAKSLLYRARNQLRDALETLKFVER